VRERELKEQQLMSLVSGQNACEGQLVIAEYWPTGKEALTSGNQQIVSWMVIFRHSDEEAQMRDAPKLPVHT
jgi:hypothetical protein